MLILPFGKVHFFIKDSAVQEAKFSKQRSSRTVHGHRTRALKAKATVRNGQLYDVRNSSVKLEQ